MRVFPQLRRETLPEASLTYPSSAVVGEGTDLVIEETPTQVEDPEVDEWTKNQVTKGGKTYFSSAEKFYRGVSTRNPIEEAQDYMKDESIPPAEKLDPLFNPRWLNIEGYARTCMLASMTPNSHFYWPSTSNDFCRR